MSKSLWVVIVFSRLLINLSARIHYPFLPAIARGLGISLEQAGLLVAIRHSAGLSAIVFGLLSARTGYLRGMQIGLVLLCLGAFLTSLGGPIFLAAAGFLFMGLAKAAYDPNVQAFVSARTAYGSRARAMGLLESSWAGSWLLGIPLSGFLIAYLGWNSPFAFLTMASLAALFLSRFPRGKEEEGIPSREAAPPGQSGPARSVLSLGKRSAVIAVSLLMSFANENLVIVYGAWIEEDFQLQVAALGLFSILIGAAELAGELTVMAFVDRIGKRRAILIGLLLTALSYVALPHCRFSMALALAGLAGMFFLFEVTIVSSFPYVSELTPSNRGHWLALNFCSLILGRLAGAVSGPWLWQQSQHDLNTLALISAAMNLAAFMLLLWAGPARKGQEGEKVTR